MKTIAKDMHLSLASVKRSIQELERSAYIKKENRFRDNGGKSSNLYFIEWIWKRTKKSPPQKTMKKRQGGGPSSAWAMVWLSVSRECELFTLTVTSYTEKERNTLNYINLRIKRVLKKKRWVEKIRNADAKPLAEFMNDTKLHGVIRAMHDISNGGFWYTAFHV